MFTIWHCDITEDSARHVISGSSSKLMPKSTFNSWSNTGFIFLKHYTRTVLGVSSIFNIFHLKKNLENTNNSIALKHTYSLIGL